MNLPMVVTIINDSRDDDGQPIVRLDREYIDASRVVRTATKYHEEGWYPTHKWPGRSPAKMLTQLIFDNGDCIYNVDTTPDEFYESVMLAIQAIARTGGCTK